MKDMLRARAARTLAAVAATLSVMAVSGNAAQITTAQSNMCASGEPQARVEACTQELSDRRLDTPARITAYVNRATAYDALEQADPALRDFQSALDLDPTNAIVLRTRATVLARRGRPADALADLTRALAAHPDDLSLLKVRGSIYADTGQAGRAVEDFSKVLDSAPGDLQARQARALVLAAAGDDQRAVMDLNRLLERNPRAWTARAARAFSLFRLKQYRLAIFDWDRLLEEDPSRLPIVYCRGAAKVLSGDETGRAEMESVRQQKPEVAAAESAACPVS